MTSKPEPDELERPCFVPDEDDPHEREVPMSVTLCWDDDVRRGPDVAERTEGLLPGTSTPAP